MNLLFFCRFYDIYPETWKVGYDAVSEKVIRKWSNQDFAFQKMARFFRRRLDQLAAGVSRNLFHPNFRQFHARIDAEESRGKAKIKNQRAYANLDELRATKYQSLLDKNDHLNLWLDNDQVLPNDIVDFAEDNKDVVLELITQNLKLKWKFYVEIGIGQGAVEHNVRFLK